MAGKLRIDLGPAAVERLNALMRRYGEDRPEALVGRALSLLEMVQDYVGDDGILTVVDPEQDTQDEHAEPYVELLFENARGHRSPVTAETR